MMSQCLQCGTVFSCGMVAPGATGCWCADMPALPAPHIARLAARSGGTCLCPSCLALAGSGVDCAIVVMPEPPADS